MSAARRRPSRFSHSQTNRIWAAGASAILLGLLVLTLFRFFTGYYLVGRVSSFDTGQAWDAYGAGAYSSDSVVYLVLASAIAPALLFTVLAALGRLRRHSTILAPASFGSIALGSTLALVVLAVRVTSGAPFQNFQDLGAETLLYTLVATIPVIAILGVVAVAVQFARKPRSS